MIVVIADDLTGAAELGGIGLRYGLDVEIVTSINSKSNAGLLVIATDTRSMPKRQALMEMAEVTAALYEIKPDLIFKKVDSVLRGHVIAELNTHLYQLGLKRALLVPTNPAFGRTLTNGCYFINGEPIHLSSFANDPEFAITSSDVIEMLRVQENEVHVHTKDDELPLSGIVVGDCTTNEDLQSWIARAGKDMLLAGGSGLFTALLKSLNLKQATEPGGNSEIMQSALFVCGSTFINSKQLVEKVNSSNGPVSYMPVDIVKAVNPSESQYEKWADDVITLLKKHKKAIIAIQEGTTKDIEISARSLRSKTAMVVEKIFQKAAINELLVEGGATAAAIIKRLNFNSFTPVNEFNTGVIRMKINTKNNLFLTLKPGSYDWPPHIWNF
jgi:uncharacterized protein YgbK (DUF1537 family)